MSVVHTARRARITEHLKLVPNIECPRTMYAIAVVLLNALSFAPLAYIANLKGYYAMAALAAAGVWLFGVTGVLIFALALMCRCAAALRRFSPT